MNIEKQNSKMIKKMNVSIRKSTLKKLKWPLVLFLLIFYCVPVCAQETEITNRLTTWGEDIKTILNTIVGIFAFVGGFLIFIQYMQGNEQAQKNFIRFIIGLAIFGLVALVANMFIPGSASVTTP